MFAVIKIKAQAWSMDVTLAVIIFIAAFFVIYGIITSKAPGDISELQAEAEKISKEATSENSSLSLMTNEVLNETKIQELLGKDYSEIKRKLRLERDFCIYFEDEEGNLIIIQNTEDPDKFLVGVGSPDITVVQKKCGQWQQEG